MAQQVCSLAPRSTVRFFLPTFRLLVFSGSLFRLHSSPLLSLSRVLDFNSQICDSPLQKIKRSQFLFFLASSLCLRSNSGSSVKAVSLSSPERKLVSITAKRRSKSSSTKSSINRKSRSLRSAPKSSSLFDDEMNSKNAARARGESRSFSSAEMYFDLVSSTRFLTCSDSLVDENKVESALFRFLCESEIAALSLETKPFILLTVILACSRDCSVKFN